MSFPDTSVDPHRHTLRGPRFWLAPLVVVTAVMAALGYFYLGSMLEPSANLREFPMAIVNQDVGDVMPGSDAHRNLGTEITGAVLDGIDSERIDLQEMGIAAAHQGLDSGDLYGAIVIPSDFTKRTSILAQASVVPGDIEKPVITVYSNPRTGTFASAIVGIIGDEAMTTVNTSVGAELTKTVTATLAETAPDLQLSGGSKLTLAEPINVLSVEHKPLPAHTGSGLSAFYYTLLLILAGFTGATIVSSIVDSALGFVPTEYGPLYITKETTKMSRLRVLFLKWAIMVVLALVVSALYLWIGTALGMPVARPLLLWEYGALAITAVGVTSLAVMSVFGPAGLLVNLMLFVVLGLPSSGGTIPIEASPPLFEWLATFEPMHQIYLAVRAILYFDGNLSAGLAEGTKMTLVGLGVGLLLGIVVTWIYDRRGFHRIPDAPGTTRTLSTVTTG
ncbi:YhgE/Pip domain-containing protein [Rhodococcus coprophilus]|uniref:Hypothetical membrane protein n=1 Tax=Rhodococcus coprophilus TaxID=38310 RepID=A0A2X4U7Z0_9NOCA|nr:DUF3533 domain-containing protein [Rhodococcus coprophilus]MBM7459128.1 YhgE/Pip-like protein [Rhodococcus coprophilus]SQI34749.1 hypothetical membrane protein [Rhodococcus coprophilus]